MGSSIHHQLLGYCPIVTVLSCASQAVGWRGRASVKGKEGLGVTSDEKAASCILCKGWALTKESELS